MINHNGEVLNSKTEWNQPRIIRTTIVQGGAEMVGGRVLPFQRDGGQEGKGQQQQGSRAGRQREGEQAATCHWSSWPGLRGEREGGHQTRSQLGLGDLQPEPVVKISVFYL